MRAARLACVVSATALTSGASGARALVRVARNGVALRACGELERGLRVGVGVESVAAAVAVGRLVGRFDGGRGEVVDFEERVDFGNCGLLKIHDPFYFGKRRQFSQATQPQIIQKLSCRGIQRRTTRRIWKPLPAPSLPSLL